MCRFRGRIPDNLETLLSLPDMGRHTAGVIWKDGKLPINLRPPKGLLEGLWEFPGRKQEDGEDLKSCLRREIREELGIDIEVGDLLVSVKHGYSHFRIILYVFRCEYTGARIQLRGCDDFCWIEPGDLDQFAFPADDRKAIQMLGEKMEGGLS